jgi:hypothetical protein
MPDRVDELLRIAAAISRGEVPPIESNECFTAGAFDLLLVKARGDEAFELLQTVCDRYGSMVASGQSLSGYFMLIAQLARQTDTTEMPQGLEAIMAGHPEQADEIAAWYRRTG